MKKLTGFIKNLTNKIYSNLALRITFYVITVLLLVVIYLFAEGQKIEFVYNDF